MHKLLVLLIALLVQSDWLNETQDLIIQIDSQAVHVKTTELKDKDGQTTIKNFAISDLEKLSVIYDYSNLVDIEVSFYSKSSFLFAQRMVGQDVMIYKRERQTDEPYASISESHIYFQTETFGIKQSRKINVHETDNIDELKLELKNKKFAIDTLNNTDYQRLVDKLSRAKTTHNKSYD